MEVSDAAEVHELTLIERANLFRRQHNLTIADLAREIGCSRPRLSQYLSGTYQKNPARMEKDLMDFLDAFGAQTRVQAVISPPHQQSGLLETTDAKNILGVCRSAQDYREMGLIVGRSGFGKSYTLQYYARLPKVIYVTCNSCMGVQDVLDEIEAPLHFPKYSTSSTKRANRLRNFFNANPGCLMIIDEADKLLSTNSRSKLDILRSIFDQSAVGTIFAGEPALEVQIETIFPMVANRIGPYAKLQGLTAQDVRNYLGRLDGYEFEEAAVRELVRRACNERNGCFRLLDRTLRYVFRLLDGKQSQKITLDIVNAASNTMFL